jgi:hypothetical protein
LRMGAATMSVSAPILNFECRLVEPLALEFDDEPTKPTDLSSAARPTASVSSHGAPTRAPSEPGALDFGDATSSTPPVGQPRRSSAVQKVAVPTELDFPPEAPRPVEPGSEALFGQKAHRLQELAEEQARALEPGLYEAQALRVNNLIEQLLPLGGVYLETWTDAALEIGRKVATESAALNRDFTKLGAVSVLDEVAMAASPATPASLLDRFKRSSLRSNMPLQEARVEQVKQGLATLRHTLTDLHPRSEASNTRLACHYLALRAVRDVRSASANDHAKRLMDLQVELLREASSQAAMVHALVARTKETVSTLHVQAQQLLTVVISFIELARSGKA